MANIRVTPETLNTQGNELIGYSSDLKEIIQAVDRKINEIIDGWDGLAQDAYFDMYNSMKKGLDEFPGLVEALGTATTSAADAFSSVDETLRDGFKGTN